MWLGWFVPYERVLDLPRGPAWPEWFVGGRLNLARNAITAHLPARADRLGIVWENDEDAGVRRLTYAELEHEVARAAGALRAHENQDGERVTAAVADDPRGGDRGAGGGADRRGHCPV